MNFFEMVYQVVREIPRGKVTNYGTIASLIGRPRASRLIGYALHANPSNSETPCHRVVMKDGSLSKGFAFGGVDQQKYLLMCEGVFVNDDNKVDMEKYGWKVNV